MNSKKIIFLWANPVPYQTAIYEALVTQKCRVLVFNLDGKTDAPYVPQKSNGVTYYKSSKYTYEELFEFIMKETPDMLVVCGWYCKIYKKIAKNIKKRLGVPVLCKVDTQYLHTWKQLLGFIIAPWYIKTAFSHILVPGVRQYHFARRMGYDRDHIILNGLSANTSFFHQVEIGQKEEKFPKTFIFVGRLVEVKGLDILMEAWEKITEKLGWSLKIIGNGPLKSSLKKHENIEILDHLSQEELLNIAEKSGIFILPSTYEAWSLAIHEFAAAGMPILCSETCGAVPHFVINGYNGYTFKTRDVDDLKNKIEKLISMKDSELYRMSINSRLLSHRITPEITAASILSVIK